MVRVRGELQSIILMFDIGHCVQIPLRMGGGEGQRSGPTSAHTFVPESGCGHRNGRFSVTMECEIGHERQRRAW